MSCELCGCMISVPITKLEMSQPLFIQIFSASFVFHLLVVFQLCVCHIFLNCSTVLACSTLHFLLFFLFAFHFGRFILAIFQGHGLPGQVITVDEPTTYFTQLLKWYEVLNSLFILCYNFHLSTYSTHLFLPTDYVFHYNT